MLLWCEFNVVLKNKAWNKSIELFRSYVIKINSVGISLLLLPTLKFQSMSVNEWQISHASKKNSNDAVMMLANSSVMLA